GWHDADTRRLLPVAQAGDHQGYTRDIVIYTDDRTEGRGPSGTAFRERRPYVCNDIFADPATQPWRAHAERHGFRASAVFPIRIGEQACGTINVYADTQDFFQAREISLLEGAANDISYALDNLAREQARHQAEDRALNEQRFSDAMIESMPGVVYLYDEQGRFLRWNRNFETVTGYSASEVARMHPRDFFSPADQPALAARVAEVFAVGEGELEAAFLTRAGLSIPYYFTGRRLRFQDRVCLVGVGVDISERTRALADLRELNENLEQRVAERTAALRVALDRAESADRLKSAFLATMSHELRTPLNSIIGFTGILLQQLAGPLNPEQTKQLGMVQGSARHLLDLINDVLDLSKIEAGQLTLRHEPFDLRAVAEQVVSAIRPLAAKKHLELDLAIAPDLVSATSGDARRVGQILLNLLNNAVKFTDRGSVTLSIAPFAGASAPAARLTVRDTGSGIRAEDLAKLFQPFQQLDSGLDRQHEGTGLGLAICRRLANLMGGTIEVSSTWSEGSEFSLILPLHAPPHPSASSPATP
nr:ATP-binding protein [Opitutaceae bacterium]